MVEESGRTFVAALQAAERLGISRRRVYDLVRAQKLAFVRVGGRLLVDSDSVESLADAGERVGRPLSPRRAWGLILLASGEDPRALDVVTRSKLRRMLRERNLWSMRARLSRRAAPKALRAHPSDLRRIDQEPHLVRTGPRFAANVGISLIAPDTAAAYYVDAKTAASLIGKYRLAESSDPNVILRIVPDEVRGWLSHPVAPRVAVALDVAEERDARSRAAAEAALSS